ncbi:hypothetical protein PCL_12592 [Purpureocillium lilacinum]|uniref:Uncharacterized protein n=1 Tax=Purpureocillium lilacinum TaxID=33203 RepID=A0A2U3E9P3_PURLI|nr:hypothetical protein Purlil1_8733 [Purpureocillium lilacinum]PWI71224.1 hypothetical protein PCL_12592 [Purpureocillium lilacinum]
MESRRLCAPDAIRHLSRAMVIAPLPPQREAMAAPRLLLSSFGSPAPRTFAEQHHQGSGQSCRHMLGSIRPRGNAASHHGTVLPSSLPGPVGQHSLTRASKPHPLRVGTAPPVIPMPMPMSLPLRAEHAERDARPPRQLTSIAPGPKSHHPSPFVFRPPRVILLRSPSMINHQFAALYAYLLYRFAFFSLLLDPGSLRPRCLKKLKPIGLVMSRLLPLPLARAMPPSREVTPSGMGRRLAKAIFALPSLSPILSSARAPARLFPRSATPLPFPGNGPPSIPQISSDFDSFPPDTPPIQQRTAHTLVYKGKWCFCFLQKG